MSSTKFTTTKNPAAIDWQKLLNTNPRHPHIHVVDMSFRQTSTWQDQDCEIGIWQKEEEILAWAVFLPPWWNLDYSIHPAERGSDLEKEIFAWGKEQMAAYSKRSGESFWGSIELFENTPNAERTIEHLTSLGFKQFDWSTIRFEIAVESVTSQPQLPKGFTIRPFGGKSEVDDYVGVHRAAFGSDKMTKAWRTRMLAHPAYQPEIDLVITSPEGKLVGFCICWIWNEIGQIEPLGVHPDYQELGLGRALELSAFQRLRDQGARCVHLDHVSLNKKAISLSLKTGFRQCNNALRYYVDTDSL